MSPSTTPSAPSPHGAQPRGLETTPSSNSLGGRYGRMFRTLPVYSVADASLIELGNAMIQPIGSDGFDQPLGSDDDDENKATLPNGELRLPAGYTYFGQYVDHDITFDPVSSLSRQDDPDALTDFRTPKYDLDSLYGRGPSDQPYMYEPDGVHLTLGTVMSATPDSLTGGPDLLRVGGGRAIIGDPRNDENLIISQLQSTMIRFHNAIVEQVQANNAGFTTDDVLKKSQQVVRWHYQWVVIHDFLPRLVGDDVVEDILQPKPYLTSPATSESWVQAKFLFYKWKQQPYMPVEFSVAAYRYGHSVVRPSYLINDVAVTSPPIAGVNRIPLFPQSGSPDATAEPLQSLSGFRPLPEDWGVDWKYFLPGINNSAPLREGLPQPSYKLDATLSNPLGALPASTAAPEIISFGTSPNLAQVLAIRNLFRGKQLGLPSGQDVARAMGITPLTDDQLFAGITLTPNALADLSGKTPLWYYILKEAEIVADSAQLGPVGGRIVAEVLIGLLVGDPLSYFNVEPTWVPELSPRNDGTFTLTDIVNIAIPQHPAPPVPPSPYSP